MKKVILLVVMILSIFTGCNDDKTKQYVEKQAKKQDENRIAFNNNYDAVSKFVFEKYPNAKTILYGDLYLTQEETKKVKMFLRPSTIEFKSEYDFIKNSGTYKINEDNSFEKLYILTANINTDGINNIQIEPFKKNEWRDVEWKWDVYNIFIKIMSNLAPFVLDIIEQNVQAGDTMGLISTTIIPSKVVNKENFEKTNLSNNVLESMNETVSKVVYTSKIDNSISYTLNNNDKTITVTYKDGKSIVLPIDASKEFIEDKIKESTIDLNLNSSMLIEINNTKAYLISLDFNNVVTVYKKDNEVITKKIPNTRIKSRSNGNELSNINRKPQENLYKAVEGLQPVIEIRKDDLIELIR